MKYSQPCVNETVLCETIISLTFSHTHAYPLKSSMGNDDDEQPGDLYRTMVAAKDRNEDNVLNMLEEGRTAV